MNDTKLTSISDVEDVLSVALSQMRVQEDVIRLRLENEELKKALDAQTEELTTLQEQYGLLNEQCKQMRCCENCGHYNFYKDECECPRECISLNEWMR